MVPAQAQPQVDLSEKKILILHTLESSTPLSLATNRGLLDTLRPGGIPGANLFFESMDLRRNPGPEFRRLLVEQMRLEWSPVINREFTLWDFRYYIIGALVFCLLETALIIFLIVQRHRKKSSEDSLRERTEELDQFFNVSLDLLCIANTDGYFLRLNSAWETTLGYTREELMAKRFLEFVHPDDLDRTRDFISILVSQQKIFFFENRYRCKDGTYRWLQWSSAPAGNLVYAAARDVTKHKEVQEKLKKSEERFRMLVETMNEGFGVQNENGVWTYANDTALLDARTLARGHHRGILSQNFLMRRIKVS